MLRLANFRSLALLVAAVAGSAPRGHAQVAPSVRVSAENDYFDFRVPPGERRDDNYTQGARVTIGNAGIVGWRALARGLPSCALEHDGRCGSTTLELGQLMFTPASDEEFPLPGERQYAGWLYGKLTGRVEQERRLFSGAVTLGVTGPPSLAGAAQVGFHRLTSTFRGPYGWEHQLPTEVAGSVAVEDSRLLADGRGGGRRVAELVLLSAAEAGTVRVSGGGGVRVRAGYALDHPWRRRGHDGRRVAAYLLAGARAEAVARDLFLDGNTFGGSERLVQRTPVTGQWEWGVGGRLGRAALEYRLVTQSREYRTGPSSHPVGIIVATLLH